MVRISMTVVAESRDELLEVLKHAGPDVVSFHGEIEPNMFRQPEFPEIVNPENPEPSTDEPAEPTPVYSKDEVRAELRKVMNLRGSEAMREILSRYGSPKLDGVPEEAYPAIIADVQKALEDAC